MDRMNQRGRGQHHNQPPGAIGRYMQEKNVPQQVPMDNTSNSNLSSTLLSITGDRSVQGQSVHGGRRLQSQHTFNTIDSDSQSHINNFDDSFSRDPLGDLSILSSGFGFDGGKDSVHSSRNRFQHLSKMSRADSKMLSQEQMVYDRVPPAYIYNPRTTDPILFFLPKAMAQAAAAASQTQQIKNKNLANQQQKKEDDKKAGKKTAPPPPPAAAGSGTNAAPSLRVLLAAAEDDIRLHRARVKASLEGDPRFLRTYRLESDPLWQERQARITERNEQIVTLKEEAEHILSELKDSKEDSRGLTLRERTQVQLARWQRALELYVQCHRDVHDMDHLTVLDKLLDGVSEEEEMSEILSEATNMCSALVDSTGQILKDAAENVSDVEDAYQIRLEAHELFARTALTKTEEIQSQFRINGRAALQIGHQLEFAESKRSQCESASKLIRRWWLLENLAEQEELSNEPIRIEQEVRGVIPEVQCRMDPLFTRPEQSLEAAKALKQLRAVVRSRGTNANSASATAGTATGTNLGTVTGVDKNAARRFELTANLIKRTSDALEQRLLHSFSEIYASGGVYDFSAKPRIGAVDWRELQALSQALLTFDSGRNLHQRYVDMVVMSRFPELFTKDDKKKNEDDEEEEFDMDATCSKLSSLFHRVSDVCSAEFELIAHVFGSSSLSDPSTPGNNNAGHQRTDLLEGNESMPLVVTRALLQRVISDPHNGLQGRINDLLESIDRTGDFDSGAKKLDTFVVIHEKAAGLFSLLKDSADRMVPDDEGGNMNAVIAAKNAVESLKGFLTSQELQLSNTHRQSYINLELRLLHHDCCSSLDQAGCTMVKPPPPRIDPTLAEKGILEEYRAPILPLHKDSLLDSNFKGVLAGPLKPSVLRQPLIHATDSLARARLMFGTNVPDDNNESDQNLNSGSGGKKKNKNNSYMKNDGETTAKVITSIYKQMCNFYGQGFLYPVMEVLKQLLQNSSPPSQPPILPFNEEQPAHNLGVEAHFWVALERLHSAAKSFDRELWAESRDSSGRVWDILQKCCEENDVSIAPGPPTGTSSSSGGNHNNNSSSGSSLAEIVQEARQTRFDFYTGLEKRGEAAMLCALDTLSTHIQWILVTGGESMLATGATSIMQSLTGQSGGPYAIPSGSSLETPNSPAVKSLTFCLRVQFVNVQNALTPQSRSRFWTALSMRLYDILVARLLQHYLISTVGAVILFRDVEALRSVAMLAGSNHQHWDTLRELLSLYMTPPEGIRNMLIGTEASNKAGSSEKGGGSGAGSGLFQKAGKDQCLVFLSRRVDYRYKTAGGLRKSGWVVDLLNELRCSDPSDGKINIGLYAAGRQN